MRKIILVSLKSTFPCCDYENENEMITSIIPQTEWMEVTDEEYNMYDLYARHHYDSYRVIELFNEETSPEVFSKEKVKEWYDSFHKKEKERKAKAAAAAKQAAATRKAKAEEKKKKQLEKLANELGVKIEV